MEALRVTHYFPTVLMALGLNYIQAHMLVRNAEDLDPPSALPAIQAPNPYSIWTHKMTGRNICSEDALHDSLDECSHLFY